jgi:hypothetical protein
METCVLAANVAVFIGVVCLVLLLDRWRRANLEQFAQTKGVLNECLKTLQDIYANNYSARELVQHHGEGLRDDLRTGIASLSAAIESAREGLQKDSKEVSSTLVSLAEEAAKESRSLGDRLSTTSHETTSELLKGIEHVAEKIKALQDSLEASVKF